MAWPLRTPWLRALAPGLAFAACATLGPPLPPAPPIDAQRIAADVAWLADDARGGRGAGTAGLDEAADYLARGFRDAGLAPGGPDGRYTQPFEMALAIRVARQELALSGAPLEAGVDFGAFAASADGRLEGEVVFAGYGITAPHGGWDDYAGLDVEGRIVLVLDDRPPGKDGPLAGPRAARFLQRAAKLANARRHGAAGLLMAPSSAESTAAPGEGWRSAANPSIRSSGLPALWLSREAAGRIAAAAATSMDELQHAIDASGRPASRPLPGPRISLDVQVVRERGPARNVIAVLEGTDPRLGHEVVVIGAHYDHLGRGSFGSLSPDRRGEIHNGADDNASGAAGLLGLARAFAGAAAPRRTLVLAAFSGEELGLAGSRAYVEDPPFPLEDTVAMLNLDMIGRLRDGRLHVFGTETSPGFRELARRAAAGLPLRARLGGSGYAPSDQTSFYARGIPVLLFFTGVHAQYHTPDDDAEHLDAEGEALVLRVVYRAARALLDADTRPIPIAAERQPDRMGTPGYGPYLGTVPDFVADAAPGVRIQAVRADSPAEKAGLRGGDRIVEFDGASVANLEEFAALLFASRPGDRVELVVMRDGERLRFVATLGRRR